MSYSLEQIQQFAEAYPDVRKYVKASSKESFINTKLAQIAEETASLAPPREVAYNTTANIEGFLKVLINENHIVTVAYYRGIYAAKSKIRKDLIDLLEQPENLSEGILKRLDIMLNNINASVYSDTLHLNPVL